jgi:predicted O-linked N-acetylglucosamine transferase (SPINDLY family)
MVDIALDPFPHNAGTTTIEALFLGVPVITRADRPTVGRFGASILGCVGLGDLVAEDDDAYVVVAIRLAGDIPALARSRFGLRDRVEASPLRDAGGLARSVELAYRALWRDCCEQAAQPAITE